MARKFLYVVPAIALLIAGLASAPAQAEQAVVDLSPNAFITNCNSVGVPSGGGSNYACSGRSHRGPVKVACMFHVQGTTCSWDQGSGAFARIVIGYTKPAGITINPASIPRLELGKPPRIGLPGFASQGPRNR